MKTILVAGGAGYIGSHTVALLKEKNYNVIVLDNLSTGHYKAIKNADKIYIGDLTDQKLLNKIFLENKIDGVIDFAACALVRESMKDPIKYYKNNIESVVSLLDMMHKHNVNNVVFSSTCAVYGNADTLPINEETATCPINPYGDSKLSVEHLLKWCD
jgi:UDP-glucose 4-epimerase